MHARSCGRTRLNTRHDTRARARHNFQKFKLQITNLDLSPFETDRLRKLRRKELSCVYASRQREKAKAKEREKQQAHG